MCLTYSSGDEESDEGWNYKRTTVGTLVAGRIGSCSERLARELHGAETEIADDWIGNACGHDMRCGLGPNLSDRPAGGSNCNTMAGRCSALGAFLLDERMSKFLLGVVCGVAMTVNVMSDLVHQNIVEIKCANGIEAVVAELEWMCAEEHALAPVDTVAAERTGPRALLLASAGEEEDSPKSTNVLRRHAPEALLDLATLSGVDKVWSEERQRDDARKRWLRRQPVMETLVCGSSFRKERVVERPISELGFTVGVASWP